MDKLLYEVATGWGVHEVTPGYGKYVGKFIAQSRGWGGAKGYFKVFDTLEDAKSFVDQRTAPRPEDPQRVIPL